MQCQYGSTPPPPPSRLLCFSRQRTKTPPFPLRSQPFAHALTCADMELLSTNLASHCHYDHCLTVLPPRSAATLATNLLPPWHHRHPPSPEQRPRSSAWPARRQSPSAYSQLSSSEHSPPRCSTSDDVGYATLHARRHPCKDSRAFFCKSRGRYFLVLGADGLIVLAQLLAVDWLKAVVPFHVRTVTKRGSTCLLDGEVFLQSSIL